ncbi:MAG: methionine gamma-lyase family protein [Bacillota bacterium]|nr:methionine gamma-lyase family protein [Bacillota bacterium]
MTYLQRIEQAEQALTERFRVMDRVAEYNQKRVLDAMRTHRLSDMHFAWNTGYGYDDAGREITERIFADVLGTEDAIVRPTIASGTHAIALMLTGLLKSRDVLLCVTGKPYDTLDELFGFKESDASTLRDLGIQYKQIELLENGMLDLERIYPALMAKPDYLYIQRSSGYAWRRSLTVRQIDDLVTIARLTSPNTVILLDNCYGEFIERSEPGVDVMAGSLIKNPGGGLALAGGYVAGRRDLIDRIAQRMTVPGLGKEVGLMFGQTRNILQGLFMAPTVVAAALKGAVLCASVFQEMGYRVNPGPDDPRSDIIQAIELGDAEKVLAFCRGIQAASPVNSHVVPIGWSMPGYQEEVVMAAGAFVQGSSIELSADAPLREPFIVYYQGGLTYAHAKIGIENALKEVLGE